MGEVMVDTVLDTAMVDTVTRDPLKLMPKPGTVTLDTDTVPDTVLELTDTVLDTVPDTDSAMLDTAPDTVLDTDTDVDTDTDTRFLSNQLTKETILYKIMP